MDSKERIKSQLNKMLSQSENKVRLLIENNFSGAGKEEALLYHISVERKFESVKLWFQNVDMALPDFIQSTRTKSAGEDSEAEDLSNLEYTVIKISAFIDAFFMSGISTLDTFAHELRNLYGLGGHTGDIYFKHIPRLLKTHHSNTELYSYINLISINNLYWYKNLTLYRKASAHESIIPIKASLVLDPLSTEWKTPILKLPLDIAQRPLQYNEKNFIDTGKEIKDGLNNFLIESYSKILNDINNNKTRIAL